jgi:multidrug resistance efflux pump
VTLNMSLFTRKIIQIICLFLLFFLSAHWLRADRIVEAAGEDANIHNVGNLQEVGTGLQVEGRLVPKRFVNLAMRSSGSIEEVFVKEGDWVESGQILLRQSGGDQLLAEIAAAEMELLLAQQGLDALYKNADLARAQAGRELAQAEKEFEKAEYKVSRLKRPTPQLNIDQAYANMLLAENALNKGRDDLSRIEKKFANPNHFLWMFFNKRQVRLLLTSMERNITSMQERYEDSIEKYEDRIAPVDEVDLALAEADLAFAQARLTDAERKYASLIDGPDPDEVAAAQARITAAEVNLRASQNALEELELLAPFAGTVVEMTTKPGEWVEVGQPVVVLAEVSEWVVETEDLTELQVPQIRLGQGATVIPEALPELRLSGSVESISKISEIKSGDVTYTARIQLNETDPHLRWGMTVAVIFEE